MTQAESTYADLIGKLKCNYFINNELMVCSRDTKSNHAVRTLWEYCCHESGWNNNLLRKLDSSTTPVSIGKYLLLRAFYGYKQIMERNRENKND